MKDEPDHVTGIAVLREVDDGREYLTILCRSDKTRTIDTLTIPVVEHGQAHNHKQKPWVYAANGDTLHVSPSVRWMGRDGQPDVFHNGGQWSVKYFRMNDANNLCKDINAAGIEEVLNHWKLYPK